MGKCAAAEKWVTALLFQKREKEGVGKSDVAFQKKGKCSYRKWCAELLLSEKRERKERSVF